MSLLLQIFVLEAYKGPFYVCWFRGVGGGGELTVIKWSVTNQSGCCDLIDLLQAHQCDKAWVCHKGRWVTRQTMGYAKAGVDYNKQGLWLTPSHICLSLYHHSATSHCILIFICLTVNCSLFPTHISFDEGHCYTSLLCPRYSGGTYWRKWYWRNT